MDVGHKIKSAGIIATILMIMISVVWLDIRIKASVMEIAKARVQLSETENISRIVNREVVANTSYEDLVQIHKDQSGRIVLIQQNTMMINKIIAATTERISESMEEMNEETVSVPLGQVSGSALLAGYGPKLKVKVIPCGQVQVNILNRFDEAGVNQTRHLIYCHIKTVLKIAVPMMDEEIKVSAVVPLAETIIIGDVPKTYVNYNEKKDLPYSILNDE